MTFATDKFLRYLFVATIVMVAEFLMALSDSIVCGHIVGENGLSAINLLQCIFEVVTFSSLMVMVGASSLYSAEIGASRESKAHGYFTLGFLMSCTMGLLLAFIVFCVKNPFLSSFDVSQIIRQYANDYLMWYLPAIVFETILSFLSMMCYSDGNPYLTFIVLISQLVLNFLASIFLAKIYGPAGAAMGSAIASFIAILLLLTHFKTKGCSLKFSRDFEARGILKIFAVSIGDASKNICRALLMVSLTYFVIAKFGDKYLPVLSVVIVMIGLSEAFDGVSIAFQPLLSVYFGEGNTFLIKRIMRVALITSITEGVFLFTLFMIYPQIPISLIGIDDPEIISDALLAVRLSSCVMLGLALTLLFNSYFAYVRREFLSTILTVLSMFLAPLLLSVGCGTFLGMKGIWLGIGLSPFIALVIIASYILLRYGVDYFPFIISHNSNSKVKVFDLYVHPKEICQTARDAKSHLLSLGVSSSRATKVALLIEETLMIVYERNKNSRIIAEISMTYLNDELTLVIRDDGEIFDLTDVDVKAKSLRVYLVANLMRKLPSRLNLVITGFNRNIFKI